jgi:hypothetical protein
MHYIETGKPTLPSKLLFIGTWPVHPFPSPERNEESKRRQKKRERKERLSKAHLIISYQVVAASTRETENRVIPPPPIPPLHLRATKRGSARVQKKASLTREIKRRIDERLDLLFVLQLAARGDGARGLAPGVKRVLALVVLRLARRGVDARADVAPGAVVQRLLLAPEQAGVGILVEVGCNLGDMKWSALTASCLGERKKGRRDAPDRKGRARSAPDG